MTAPEAPTPSPAADAPDPDQANGVPHAGEVTRNLRWSFIGSVYGRISSVAAGIILARLLVPKEYGHFAIGLFVLQILLTFNDGGIAYLLMRKKGDIGSLAPTAVSAVWLSSFTLYVLVFATADPLSRALGDPEASGIIRVLCLALLVDGTFAVPAALLTRSFLSDRRAIADLIGFTVTPLVSVLFASLGFGAVSLAWGWVVGACANGLAILILSPEIHRPGWDAVAARLLIREGTGIVGAGLLSVLVLNVDYVIVGRALGVEQLGLYQLAFNLSSLPIAIFSSAVRQVSIPGFATISSDLARVRAALLRSVTALGLAVMPVCVVMAAFALPGVRLVYGEQWVNAAPALRWLALLALLRVILELAADFLVACFRVRALVTIRLLWVGLLIPGLTLGAWVGKIEGVAIGHLIIAACFILPVFMWSIRSYGIPLLAWAKAFFPGLCLATVLAAASAVVLLSVSGDLSRLLIGTALVIVTYGAVWKLDKRVRSRADA